MAFDPLNDITFRICTRFRCFLSQQKSRVYDGSSLGQLDRNLPRDYDYKRPPENSVEPPGACSARKRQLVEC